MCAQKRGFWEHAIEGTHPIDVAFSGRIERRRPAGNWLWSSERASCARAPNWPSFSRWAPRAGEAWRLHKVVFGCVSVCVKPVRNGVVFVPTASRPFVVDRKEHTSELQS